MARTGILKSDVRAARDQLLARNQYPSVDLVRAALGHTGSKTTIHRYLKELERESQHDSAGSDGVAESIQSLVSRLAEELRNDARSVVEGAAEQHRLDREALTREIDDLTRSLETSRTERSRLEEDLTGERALLHEARQKIQSLQIRLAQVEQASAGLEARLGESQAYARSLEKKYENAMKALEDVRRKARQQREMDAERHDMQLQRLQTEHRALDQRLSDKQDALIQLNKENARLTTELAQAERVDHQRQQEIRDLKLELKGLPELHRRNGELRQQLKDQQTQLVEARAHLGEVESARKQSDERAARAEADKAGLAARLERLETLVIELGTASRPPAAMPPDEDAEDDADNGRS